MCKCEFSHCLICDSILKCCLFLNVLIKMKKGGYDKEEKAARAYDLAALKYWGPTTTTNFPASFILHSIFI